MHFILRVHFYMRSQPGCKIPFGKFAFGKGDMLCLTETPDGFMITPYDNQFAKQMEVAEKVMRRPARAGEVAGG